jgi:plastocyanin
MRRAVPLLLAAGLVVAPALPALASTTTVEMDNFQFNPTPVAVTMGDTVKWHAVDTTHTATSNTGLFDLVVSQGQSKSRVFKFAGSFPYYCQFHGSPGHGMHGRLDVPARWMNTGTQHTGDVQRIRVSTIKPPDGISFDVQLKGPGDDAFHLFRRKLIKAVITYTPTEPGEYQFRSREHLDSNNHVSGWSPAAFVEISP